MPPGPNKLWKPFESSPGLLRVTCRFWEFCILYWHVLFTALASIYADVLDEVSKRHCFWSNELVVLEGSKHSFAWEKQLSTLSLKVKIAKLPLFCPSSAVELCCSPSLHPTAQKNPTCSINQLFLALTPSDSLIAGYQQNRMPAAAAVSQNGVKQLAKLHFFCLLKENKLKFKRHITKREEDVNSNSVTAVVISF